MNYYEHHLGDYDGATAHLSWLEDCAYRRLMSCYYRNEAPIPADIKQACRLVRAVAKPERDAVEQVLGEFFLLEPDGWHHTRCDEEIAKYLAKKPAADDKRESDKDRQRRARERRKKLFEDLSSHGVHMPYNATTEQLQAELSRVTSRDTSQPVTQPVTRDNTSTHTPDPKPQAPDPSKPLNPVERAPGVDSTLPTPAGRVALALREQGMDTVNSSDPRLLEALKAGLTVEEIVGVGREAKGKGKGLAWILATAQGRRLDAASGATSTTATGPPRNGSKAAQRGDYLRQQGYMGSGNNDNRACETIIDGQSERLD